MLFFQVLKNFGPDNNIVKIDTLNVLNVKFMPFELLVKEVSINILIII